MTRSCTHRIEIKNLCDGEEINHSILLIRGFVSPSCFSTNSVQLVLQEIGGHRGRSLLTSVVRSGEFKALLDLQPYDCLVTKDTGGLRLPLCIRYCHQASKEVIIVYRPIHRACRLQSLYIICRSNDKPTEQCIKNTCTKIDLNLRLVQCVYAEKLRHAGFGRNTFALSSGCQPFFSTLTCEAAWQLSEEELWQYFAKELLNSSLGNDKHVKFVAFIGCTKYDGANLVATGDYSYVNIRRFLKAHAALGGGGLALFGSAFFYAWASHFDEVLDCFSNETKVEIALHPDDSNYRRTYSGVYASTLGAIIHEIGHIFDLGHSQDGVMGTGFDYLNRVFTVGSRTENLPERVMRRNDLLPAGQTKTTDLLKQTTRLNRSATNNFLDKYREQKITDSFFFSRNCAVILAHHEWLREQLPSGYNTAVDLRFETETHSVVSLNKEHPLKLIEVRSNIDSLVVNFFEFQSTCGEPAVYQFFLPEHTASLHSSHYLFVLTTTGHVQRFGVTSSKEQK